MQGTEENENGFKSKPNLNKKSMLFSQHQKPLQSVSCNGDSIRSTLCTFSKPLPRATMKSVTTTSKDSAHVESRTNLSLGNQLPQKRLTPDTVVHDDDFEWDWFYSYHNWYYKQPASKQSSYFWSLLVYSICKVHDSTIGKHLYNQLITWVNKTNVSDLGLQLSNRLLKPSQQGGIYNSGTNNRTFKDEELSAIESMNLLLRALFEWSCTYRNSNERWL